jgi:hypothetical protein
VRSAMWLCLVAAALAPIAWAHAEDTDDSLRVYAVDIVPHSSHSRSGTGVYLGKGLVITAAHVVGHAADSKPSVRIAGLDLPSNVVKEGAYEQVDLTLLSVDEQKLPKACGSSACHCVSTPRGRATRSSSQFPKARHARASCRRDYFPLASKPNSPR